MNIEVLYRLALRARCFVVFVKWAMTGRPLPAPHRVKRKVVLDYARRYCMNALVETGTYLGDMVDAVRLFVGQVHSIELSEDLYVKAVERFSSYTNIFIYHGDSSEVLSAVLDKVQEPCLFWLDGHYSAGMTAKGRKDTPIVEELSHILKRKKYDDVILIDDAVLFTGRDGYPTCSDVSKLVLNRRPDFMVEVKDDIIRCHKKPKLP